MADYHPLIARAVETLPKNTGEHRRALYERARTALVAQLRGTQPPLEESEITRERLALEEAIRKIEAESARKAREEPRPSAPRRADPPKRDEQRPAAPRESVPLRESFAPPPARTAPRERLPERSSLSDEAMKGFRDVVSESGGSLDANPPRFTPLPPASPPAAPPQSFAPPPPQPPAFAPHDLDHFDQRPERHDNIWAVPLEAPAQDQGLDFTEEHAPEQPRSTRPRPSSRRQETSDEPVEEQPRLRPRRSYAGLIRIALALILIGGIAGGLWWKWNAVTEFATIMMRSSPKTPVARDSTAPAARPKIADRIGQPGTTPAPGPAVAQRVVLYEEEPDDPQGKRLTGQAVWHTEMTAPAPGRAPEMVVKADVTVPERNLTMTWSLRRNTDPSLPASHTIEIMFNLPADTPTGGVQNVPGVLMKQSESTRGVPLAGLAVKVTPGFFLIGLSALETDMQRNIQLLKDRPWFDIPIVYNNNRRAILAMEKGTPGEKAFADAFAAWKQ